ncbi:MAG: ABC transporter ATP-binding protein [Spirochaetales bacterium]|jgi:oligopeptide/dipeptide ABC transporter ATP-binding protein|nr:ABC transporter ATP-binding protein [Spirochaetales bacterium]
MNNQIKKYPIIEVNNLKTWFPIKRGVLAKTVGYIKAVDISGLYINRGETLGLVGESGCGKTTFGRTLSGLEKPKTGEILFYGKNILDLSRRGLRELRKKMQIIFQDPLPSLNPRMNILDIVTEGLSEFGKIEGTREDHAKKLMNEVGLDDDAIYRYPHEFSGGQRQRINIARAIALRPDFIICDEPVSALDVSVQAQVINLLMDLRDTYNLSYLFISHDLSVVSAISNRVAVMYLGRIVESGLTGDVINNPKHPYTKALINAVPEPGHYQKERIVLKGEMPSPSAPPSGCMFHTRCPEVMEICRKQEPKETMSGIHQVWCHIY